MTPLETLQGGGIEVLHFNDEIEELANTLTISSLKLATEIHEELDRIGLPQYEQHDDTHSPIRVEGELIYPYVTPKGWWKEEPSNIDTGMRLTNPKYPKIINRNTLIHLPEEDEIDQLPEEIRGLAHISAELSNAVKGHIDQELPNIEVGKLIKLTRVIMYPEHVSEQFINKSEDGTTQALKPHRDKSGITVTVQETGPGFEYQMPGDEEYIHPEKGSYLFLAGEQGCLHRVNQDIIDNSGPHKDLSPKVLEELNRSPFARTALIDFLKEDEKI